MATTPASPRLRQTIERLVQVRFMSFNHPQTTFLSKNQGFGENLKCQKLEKNSSNQFESPLSMKKNLESRSNTHLFRHLSHPFSIFEVTSPKGGVIQYSATHPTYWSTPPPGPEWKSWIWWYVGQGFRQTLGHLLIRNGKVMDLQPWKSWRKDILGGRMGKNIIWKKHIWEE